MALRIGSGFDLHRLKPGRPLVLGGVEVPWPKGPVGYSDGDVVAHALASAILGACGLGDLGDFFPAGDKRWKNASGEAILGETLRLAAEKGFKIVNADITIFLEEPHLGQYKKRMQRRLAEILNLEDGCVSVKANTAEGFGPVGTGQAVGACATVLLERECP